MTHSITWRLATQDELERTGVDDRANLIDGAAAILRDGALIGITNEYGTAVYAAPGVVPDTIEVFSEKAGDLCT